jgi:RimJ/RimL family protein N-acetyltransferase
MSINFNDGTWHIRPLIIDDISDAWISWLNNNETNRFLESVGDTVWTQENQRKWVAGFDQINHILLGIFSVQGSCHIGTMTIRVDEQNRRAHVGYLIGDPAYRGKGAVETAGSAVVDYLFGERDMHKVTGAADIRNIATIISAKRIGFEIEAVFEDHLFDGEKFHDYIYLKIFQESWAAGLKQS